MFKNQIEELAKPTMNPYKDDRDKFSISISLLYNLLLLIY